MLSTADFISQAYNDDYTQAGITHVCRSLADPTWQNKSLRSKHLHLHIAEKSAELAFLRYLQAQGIPYKIYRPLPFTEPDHHEINLGGRRCMIKTHLLVVSGADTNRASPERLLKANALVPTESITAESSSNADLVILSFVLTRKSTYTREIEQEKRYYIYRMPESWSSPKRPKPFGQIVIGNDSDESYALEIAGLSARKKFQLEILNTQNNQRVTIDTEFSSLIYLHIDRHPEKRIFVQHPATNRTHYIYPHKWRDIWIQGIQIIFTGFTTIAELRNSMRSQSEPGNAFPLPSNKSQSISFPIAHLHPLGELFTQVQSWQEKL